LVQWEELRGRAFGRDEEMSEIGDVVTVFLFDRLRGVRY
jgi:hypothetical protein